MKNIDILSNATKIHTPDGVYDGEAAHWALGEIKDARCEVLRLKEWLRIANDEIELLQSENEMLEDMLERETEV